MNIVNYIAGRPVRWKLFLIIELLVSDILLFQFLCLWKMSGPSRLHIVKSLLVSYHKGTHMTSLKLPPTLTLDLYVGHTHTNCVFQTNWNILHNPLKTTLISWQPSRKAIEWFLKSVHVYLRQWLSLNPYSLDTSKSQTCYTICQ